MCLQSIVFLSAQRCWTCIFNISRLQLLIVNERERHTHTNKRSRLTINDLLSSYSPSPPPPSLLSRLRPFWWPRFPLFLVTIQGYAPVMYQWRRRRGGVVRKEEEREGEEEGLVDEEQVVLRRGGGGLSECLLFMAVLKYEGPYFWLESKRKLFF